MFQNITNMSKSDLMNCISDRKNEIMDKLSNGDTEESFQIGGASYTQTEWDKLLGKVDANIDEIKEEQEEEKDEYIQECYEKETAKRNIFMEKLNGTYKETVPAN
jgi:hypothetical protein